MIVHKLGVLSILDKLSASYLKRALVCYKQMKMQLLQKH